MTKLLRAGLQKELFVESMDLIKVPGWGLLQELKFVALKAPGKFPFLNIVYGMVTLDNFQKAKNFYLDQSFCWVITENQRDQQLLDWGFEPPHLTFEMGINVLDYNWVLLPTELEVRQVEMTEDLLTWFTVASKWLEVDSGYVEHFFSPLIEKGKYIPFLGFINGIPAATSLVYCGCLGGAIYCLGTLPLWRNRGLGTAVTQACLNEAKKQNIVQVYLYSSTMGRPMYEKMGFKLVQTLSEYVCKRRS